MDPIKTRREGAILHVTLDRPKANAIDLGMKWMPTMASVASAACRNCAG